MSQYIPMPPPTHNEASSYTYEELLDLARALQESQPFVLLQVLNVAPEKPREGMVALADGTNWDPGSGAGYYGYRSGWKSLESVDTTQDVIVDLATKGLVLKDTQGTPHYWRLTVTTLGVLVTTDLGTTKP